MDSNTIGAHLRQARNERGLTQEELAERAGVSRDIIAKLEQGTRESARITTLTKLANALGITVSALLGHGAHLADLPTTSPRRPEDIPDTPYPTTATIGALLPAAASRTPASPEMADACSALTRDYRRLDALAGPAAVYAQAAGHQAWLADWMAQAVRGQQREIAALYADATILLAWLNFDLERHTQAIALYRECGDVADQIEDTSLRAFLAGRQARTLSEAGRHDEALNHAEAARQLATASASPQLRSWLAITRAYIHACLGDDYACRASIASAHAALDKLAPTEAPPYLAFYGPSYARKWEGHALLKLGSVRRDALASGRTAIDAALNTWAPDDIRESGEVLAACAAARRAQQEIPEAASLAAQAWQVAATTSSPRIMRYVLQLRRDLAPYRDVNAVRELDDLILGAG